MPSLCRETSFRLLWISVKMGKLQSGKLPTMTPASSQNMPRPSKAVHPPRRHAHWRLISSALSLPSCASFPKIYIHSRMLIKEKSFPNSRRIFRSLFRCAPIQPAESKPPSHLVLVFHLPTLLLFLGDRCSLHPLFIPLPRQIRPAHA